MAVDLVIRTLDVLRAFCVTTGPHPVSTGAKINTETHGYNLVEHKKTNVFKQSVKVRNTWSSIVLRQTNKYKTKIYVIYDYNLIKFDIC